MVGLCEHDNEVSDFLGAVISWPGEYQIFKRK
jgi:hypothetical protein